MLTPGQVLTLEIDKPAVGGRMIARVGGRVVLVSGAIPGEHVSARVERIGKGVAYAETISADSPSPDRRPSFGDPMCGGCLYAHIAYPRQLEIKALVVADAFARIGRVALPGPVTVDPSPEDAYRMRARLHVRGGRVGFFREGTHDLCEPRLTRQLLPATCDVLDALGAGLRSLGSDDALQIELSENVDASNRVVHLQSAHGLGLQSLTALSTDGLSGLTIGQQVIAGAPYLSDTLTLDTGQRVTIRRHVRAFFQGNRYLLGRLVGCVTAHFRPDIRLLDLYAGVGLFAVAAATARGARVTAVEGDRIAAADLSANAAPSGAVHAVHGSVEAFVGNARCREADAVVLDPPRTGLSREALTGLLRARPPQIVYVSCDVATLARDVRHCVDAGYGIDAVTALDLFPNTPHVECVVNLRIHSNLRM